MDFKIHPDGTAAGFIQRNPVAAIDLLEACKAAKAYFHNPLHPARLQLQAAIDLVEVRHAPKRVLPLMLDIQAAHVGLGLDAESLEQAEVSL